MSEPIRKAFLLRLKPDALEKYIYWHNNLWPDLKQEIATQGIIEISLYQVDDMVMLFSTVRDEESWARLWDSEVHRRWAEVMSPLMHYRQDGVVDSLKRVARTTDVQFACPMNTLVSGEQMLTGNTALHRNPVRKGVYTCFRVDGY